MNIQDWCPLGSTGLISLLSKGLSRVFSSTTVWSALSLLYGLYRLPWQDPVRSQKAREPDVLYPRVSLQGHRESDMTEWLHFHFSLSCTGEGNGNPLQYSCLENPRDRGSWWAAVYGVTQSQTRLKRLSSSSSSSSSMYECECWTIKKTEHRRINAFEMWC